MSYGITFQSAVGTKGSKPRHDESYGLLTLLGPQSRFGDKFLGTKLVCPLIGTAVLKGLSLMAYR